MIFGEAPGYRPRRRAYSGHNPQNIAYNLPTKIMTSSQKVPALRDPGPRLRLQPGNRLPVYARRRKQPGSWKKANHFIPQVHDGKELADRVAQQLFILKSVPAVSS
jgi:hypothetical protein